MGYENAGADDDEEPRHSKKDSVGAEFRLWIDVLMQHVERWRS
jgi:hypothetical protein